MVNQPAVASGGEEATGLARGRNAATVAQRQAAEVAALGHRPEGNGAATRRRGREHLAGGVHGGAAAVLAQAVQHRLAGIRQRDLHLLASVGRAEEQTAEHQSLMRISDALLCLKNKLYKRKK